jgi:predicted amidohydrolase
VILSNTSANSYMRPADLPGHGHSAVVAPDGKLLAAAGDVGERLLVVNLDLTQATLGEAEKRRTHPLFREFWDTGAAILTQTAHERAARGLPPGNDTGRKPGDPQPRYKTDHKPLVSPEQTIKIAAAQLACSQRVDENIAGMVAMIETAARENADVVVFPELAVTGHRETDIRAASQSDIEQALTKLMSAAAMANIYVAAGLPWRDGQRLFNSAVVIDPQGQLLTRYDQIVVDRPELFARGMSTRSMWFEIKGVPAVLTIGRDALWSEIAEMAALRGAQIHLHLAYDTDTSVDAQRLLQQLWANLASYGTFTATVNAATPSGLSSRSAPAAGGSVIWEDFQRTKAREEGGYFPHSAVPLVKAGRNATILYATQRVAKTNPQFARMISPTRNPQMTPWYTAGARAIYADVKDAIVP